MPARRKHFNNRFNPTPRARSQRKKIKKSLGPDFLDPSDLGYGYLKDTYDPKCYLCDFQITSGRSDKHLTCSRCSLKVHRRCLIPGDTENLNIPEEDWVCEKCTVPCALCSIKDEGETTICCAVCETQFHTLCIEDSFSEQPKLKRQGLWICRKCIDIQGEKLNRSTEPVKENKSSNISNAQLSRINMTNGKSLTLLASTVQNNDKIRQLSSEKLFIEDSPPIDFPEVETNLMNEIEPTKAEIADYHAYVSDRLAKMVKNLDMDPDPSNWSTDDVEAYVKEIGFPDQAPLFKEQLIDGRSLLLLRRVDVVKGLAMKLGPALKIYAHINQLQEIDLVPAFNSLLSQSSDNLNLL